MFFFAQHELSYLGYIISAAGVATDQNLSFLQEPQKMVFFF
jgi:hypothetical protein